MSERPCLRLAALFVLVTGCEQDFHVPGAGAPTSAGAAVGADGGSLTTAAGSEGGSLSATASTTASSAATQPVRPGRHVVAVSGKVTIDKQPAAAGMEFGERATIETGPKSRALISLAPGNIIEVREKSRLTLGSSARARVSVALAVGTLWSFFETETDYEVVTPNAVAGVRGTTFFTDASRKGATYICACQGQTHLRTPAPAKGKGKALGFDQVVDGGTWGHHLVIFKGKGQPQVKGPGRPVTHPDAQAKAILAQMPR